LVGVCIVLHAGCNLLIAADSTSLPGQIDKNCEKVSASVLLINMLALPALKSGGIIVSSRFRDKTAAAKKSAEVIAMFFFLA
jgi:hypothetical protein